ncbi:glycosyltransferase family 9 protein [bacterium]|nr:glycosyltransferase family 9 protein [bacterium]
MNDPVFSRPWWRHLLFVLLSRILRTPRRGAATVPANVRRILVLIPTKRGDYLVATPLLAGLTKARPRAEIAVVVTKAGYDLATMDPHVDRVFLYHKLPKWVFSMWQIIRYKPDVVLMPKGHPATTESMILLLTRAPFRIGLSHPHHNGLLTHPIEHDWRNEHRTEAFVRLLAPFGLDPTRVHRRIHIGISPKAEAWADQELGPAPHGVPFIAVNLSAGNNPTREWTANSYRNLIRQLSEVMPEVRFLALSAPEERFLCDQLADMFDNVTTLETRSLIEASALIAKADLLITPDTGIVQTAAARDVPMVVLYNFHHEAYAQFGPQSVPHRAVIAKHGESVSSLDPADVVHEVMHLLTELKLS